MPSSLIKTNVPEVTEELAKEILKSIQYLKSSVDDLERAVKERKPREAVAYGWIENMMHEVTSIQVNVSRINGAVLVKGTD